MARWSKATPQFQLGLWSSRKPHTPTGIPLLTVLAMGFVVGACVFVSTRSAASVDSFGDYAYADWVLVSTASHQSLIFAGPAAAAIAAWVSARNNDVRSILLPPNAMRSGAQSVVRQLFVLVAAAFVGALVGYVPVVADTTMQASWGSPKVGVMISAAMALAATVTFGYLVGTLAPAYLAASLALVIPYAITLLSDAIGPILSPVWSFFIVTGQEEVPIVVIFRSTFFALTAAAATLTSASLVRDRQLVTRLRGYRGMAFLLIPVVAIAVSSSLPFPTQVQPAPPRMCVTSGPTEVCVHQAKEVLLHRLMSAALAVRKYSGMPTGQQLQVTDDALLLGSKSQGSHEVVLSLQAQMGNSWSTVAASDIAWQLAGNQECNESDSSSVSDPAADVSAGVAVWIADKAGGDGGYLTGNPEAFRIKEHLDSMSVDSATKLLAQSYEAIASCNSSLAEIGLGG